MGPGEPSSRYAHTGPPTLPDQNQPILEGDPDDEALVDQPLDFSNEKPRYPIETIEEGDERIFEEEELADLIKPTIQNAEREEMDLISNLFPPRQKGRQSLCER